MFIVRIRQPTIAKLLRLLFQVRGKFQVLLRDLRYSDYRYIFSNIVGYFMLPLIINNIAIQRLKLIKEFLSYYFIQFASRLRQYFRDIIILETKLQCYFSKVIQSLQRKPIAIARCFFLFAVQREFSKGREVAYYS